MTNIVYSVLLPTLIAASLIVFSRRDAESRGARLVLAHLLCVLPTVILFVSEPRYRIPYDVFGLALLAALIAHFLRRRERARVADDGFGAQRVGAREPSSPGLT